MSLNHEFTVYDITTRYLQERGIIGFIYGCPGREENITVLAAHRSLLKISEI
jgi:hypothetical protein